MWKCYFFKLSEPPVFDSNVVSKQQTDCRDTCSLQCSAVHVNEAQGTEHFVRNHDLCDVGSNALSLNLIYF